MPSLPRRRLLQTLAALSLTGHLGACGRLKPRHPLRVGVNPWPGYANLYLGRELGYLDGDQVRLVPLPSTEEVLRALRHGVLDAGGLTLDEALHLLESGQDYRVILVYDISDGADVLLARPDITTLADLKGRPVGVETTALGAYLLTRALQSAGMDSADVRVVGLSLQDHEAAWRAGRVDALVTFDPVRGRLLAAGARELFSSARIPGEIVDVLVARASALETHPDQLLHLTSTHFHTLDWLRQHPGESARLLAPVLDSQAEDLLDAWRLMELPDRAAHQTLFGAGPQSLQATAQRLERIMRQHNLLHWPISVSQLISPVFVK